MAFADMACTVINMDPAELGRILGDVLVAYSVAALAMAFVGVVLAHGIYDCCRSYVRKRRSNAALKRFCDQEGLQ